MPPDLDPEEGTPADEADVESKSDALESAIWRLTAGKGGRGGGALHRGTGSGEVPLAATAGEPTSERKTAAGRVDFVLQVRLLVYYQAACLLPGCMSTAMRHVYYQAACLLPYVALLCPSDMMAESRLLTCQPRRSPFLCVILLLMCVLGIVVYDVQMVLVAVDAVVLLPHLLAASDIFVGISSCLLLF